jgi:hypothetical protein
MEKSNQQPLSKIDKHSFAHWFIIAAISKKSTEFGNGTFTVVPGWEDLTFDNGFVEFKINGVDVDFIDMMQRIKQAFDASVHDAAKELVECKIAEVSNVFSLIKNYTINELQMLAEVSDND